MEDDAESALTGTGNDMRINPLFSSRLYANVAGFQRRHVGAGAIGTVDRAKTRVLALVSGTAPAGAAE